PIRRLPDPDAAGRVRAADDRPRLALAAPQRRVDRVRVRRVQLEVDRADAVRHEQHVLPRAAAVRRTVDTALAALAERVAQRGDVDAVRVLGMDLDRADLAHVPEAQEAPGLARVVAPPDAAAHDDVRAQPEI